MYRKIGEVAELLGITPSAIRKYEEKGILTSRRQEGNEYRQYDVHDIAKFIRTRMYKNMGFSLNEAVDLLNETRIEDYPLVIEKQKEKVVQEILRQQRLLAIMNEWQREIAEVNAPIRMEYCPDVYFFQYFKDMKLVSEAAQIQSASAALRHVPLSYPGFSLQREIVVGEEERFGDVGAYVRAGDLKAFRIQDVSEAKHYEARLCVACTVKTTREQGVRAQHLKRAIAYIREHNLEVTGDVMGKFILSDYEIDDYTYYSKIWIPID